MRTIFTSYDIKEIVKKIYNGNLEVSRLSNGTIPYGNENSEPILFVDEDNGEKTEKDLAEYLNIKFYSWKNRLVEKDEHFFGEPSFSPFDSWVESLNFSMRETYALVELLDEEVTSSQDIDSATKVGRITFLVQADKIANLDYYVSKIKNRYLGNPQDIQNSYGDIVKAYITMGILLYEEEPITIQLGECIVATCNFTISYLTDALSYNDTEVQISLDGDDNYDENGDIVGETKYLTMPLTKMTWQNIFTTSPLSTSKRPDLTGFIATALSNIKTITFYDFNKVLSLRFNDLFWRCNCVRYDGIPTTIGDVNIPVYIRIKSNGHSYIYKDIIEQMEKVITNNDFNISSITLKGWGKLKKQNRYVLYFDANGGDVDVQTKIVVYEQEIGELETPTRQGYTFAGWYIGETLITSNYVWEFEESKTAVARWVGIDYTLTFDNGIGGTGTKTVTQGEPIGWLPNVYRPNYELIGWFIDNEQVTENTIWNYASNKTAYAQYAQYENLAEGTNIRNKRLQIELETAQNTLGDRIFGFDNNNVDYISGQEGEYGFWGYGIFRAIELVGQDRHFTYTIDIPNDKDYIVDYIAFGFGVESAKIANVN